MTELHESGADQPKKKTKHKKKGDDSRDSDDRLRDLLEWLEKFTHNLEDAELPASAHSSRDPDSERPMKVAPRKHSIFILTSQKTEIAKSACEPRLLGLSAEDAPAKQYLEQNSLVT